MSGIFGNGKNTQVLDFKNKKARAESVLDAIVGSHGVMVVCGPGTLGQSGIQPEKAQIRLVREGAETQTTLSSLLEECSGISSASNELREDTLGLFNIAMTQRRLQVHAAPPNQFHGYLRHLYESSNLVRCLTTNPDGIEASNDPDLEKKIVMMRGDNRVVRCLTRDCPGYTSPALESLTERLLKGDAVPCEYCTSQVQAMTSAAARRRAGPPSRRYLRPAVQAKISTQLLPGSRSKLRKRILKELAKCGLLLIVGVSLRCNDTFNLVYELGCKVKKAGGVVVYVDSQSIRGRNTEQCFDFHLRVDVELWASGLLRRVNEESILRGGLPSQEESKDIWHDVIQNKLRPETVQEAPEDQLPMCSRCRLSIDDRLLQCSGCNKYFCGKHPRKNPEDKSPRDKFESCIELNRFYSGESLPEREDAESKFVCAACWNHSEQMYPHFVRPFSRLTVERPNEPTPRMAMIVYYLDEFWPQAKHLCSVVLCRWQSQGWTCLIEPVKLEELDDHSILLQNCDWEQRSFDLYVVYLTHGLSGGKGYQIDGERSYPPVEFFERTTKNTRHLITRSHTVRAFLLCCGQPLMSAQQTKDMQQWMNRDGIFDTLVGCLNLKLAPGFMLNLMARVTIALAGEDPANVEEILTCWLSDGIACNHSDLVTLAKNQPPAMWLFSPFDSRPLGKELPSLLSACTCPQLGSWVHAEERRKKRKVWVVKHDGANNKMLKDVQVKVMCSVCLQTWKLPTEHLHGQLRKICGLYMAVVPYFALD